MSTTDARPAGTKTAWSYRFLHRLRLIIESLEHLVGGLGTAALALIVLLWLLACLITCLIGVGFLLLPGALHGVRYVADRERARLSRAGTEVIGAGPEPDTLRAAVTDPTTRREVGWVSLHAVAGSAMGMIGLALPLRGLQDLFYPVYWQALPAADRNPYPFFATIDDWLGAIGIGLLGVGCLILTAVIAQPMAWLQAWTGRMLLGPPPGTDLMLRVAELTATRAAALDAHAAELRRIERSLHDGTQNRIVAVTVLLGAARRAMTRNPAEAEAALERAQGAAEQALAELRAVVRSILPPVLSNRSLADALSALAAASPVPCRVRTEVPQRCAASVEATAYYVVAEALTNVAKHSGAAHVAVDVRQQDGLLRLEITDDGRGGADEQTGSGLAGIRRRTEAHDGTLSLASPPGGPTTLEVSLPCGS
ncbi:sensor histidine kinase [Jidongwangia harbinensis]|uniref:sensor histidine kinase n=1 Tax=Jidongwangia harbinensis TaxID=2878561 RepID=UPI001CD9D3D4|nr:sensor histidine kinase [Jidongwangia harbinensis]MCA2214246.1 sensor domain-containing protein [Jidongwangia harbinensis]